MQPTIGGVRTRAFIFIVQISLQILGAIVRRGNEASTMETAQASAWQLMWPATNQPTNHSSDQPIPHKGAISAWASAWQGITNRNDLPNDLPNDG